jgi:DNA ligase-1
MKILKSSFSKYFFSLSSEEKHENPFVLLSQTKVSNSSEILRALSFSESQGYEGIMIRFLSGDRSKYSNGRNSRLLKLKSFSDEEGTIVSVKEGKGREKGLAIFEISSEKCSKTFFVRPEGSFEQRKEWFLNSSSLLGKKYTYKFFEYSDEGIPRFPIGIGFRDYE